MELGEREEEYHKNIGRLINSSKIDFLITYGPLAQFISDEAEKTFSVERVKTFTDKEQRFIYKLGNKNILFDGIEFWEEVWKMIILFYKSIIQLNMLIACFDQSFFKTCSFYLFIYQGYLY